MFDALMMALWRRGEPKELVHHSDQGSQYTREDFQRLLAAQGDHVKHESSGRLLGQRGDGALLLVAED